MPIYMIFFSRNSQGISSVVQSVRFCSPLLKRANQNLKNRVRANDTYIILILTSCLTSKKTTYKNTSKSIPKIHNGTRSNISFS